MGFWDTVGKASKAVGEFALDEAKQAKGRSSEYSQEMPSKGDRELARIVISDLSRTPLRSMAARKELRNRGIQDNQDIKNLAR
jgi:hypothetical protein